MKERALGRVYFALQSLAGALWWVGVFTVPKVRWTTLGSLPTEIAYLDVPLFVVTSFFAAVRLRWAVWTTLAWTLLVTIGMLFAATVTREAAWGALLMVAASGGTILAATLLLRGRIPTEWMIQGPFVFRTTSDSEGHFVRTLRQLVTFWVIFLGVGPGALVLLERRWMLDVPFPWGCRALGGVSFLFASAFGVWAAWTMAKRGEGTPLPATMAKRLVVAGPYRFVRNPMAVAGITQGVAVGLIASSWLVVVYALVGSAIWNWAIRPHEERDLAERFGEEFESYRQRVSCWIPRRLSP